MPNILQSDILAISDKCIRNVKERTVVMSNTCELNRMEFMILNSLYEGGCTDPYHSMTITDLINDNEGVLGARMTIYRKMKKLIEAGYVDVGCLDNHAHTFYLQKKELKQLKGENEYEFKGKMQVLRLRCYGGKQVKEFISLGYKGNTANGSEQDLKALGDIPKYHCKGL